MTSEAATPPFTLDPQGEVAPDYAGGGIANLVSSLMRGLGGSCALPEARALPAATVSRARSVVLLVIDGLGAEFLARRPDSFLCRNMVGRLTSVFPSTTASAITTFMSGLTPAAHGLTGWFTYLRALGSVATVLPFHPRPGGSRYTQLGVDPRAIFDWTPLFDRIEAHATIVTPEYLVDSDYSRTNGGRARRIGYRGLDGLLDRTREAASRDGRQYVYSYWAVLDALCHRAGAASADAETHFRTLDRAVEQLAGQLRGVQTLLLVSADHGHIDTSPQRTVRIEDHPTLHEALRLPLCGEPRVAYCYVIPDRSAAFEDFVRSSLQEQCRLLTREQLLASGWLGPQPAHPSLASRIGDYVLVMRDNWVIRDRLLGEEPLNQIGVHGGISNAEMLVPLVVVD